MKNHTQKCMKRWIFFLVGVFFLAGCANGGGNTSGGDDGIRRTACPDVTARITVSPPAPQIEEGADPISLTARVSGASNLRMEWTLQGPGRFEGDPQGPGILYFPPENINRNLETVIISLKVTDIQGCETLESSVFNIVSRTSFRDNFIESFDDYAEVQELQQIWRTDIASPGGVTNVQLDTETAAPNVGSSKSLQITTHIPCPETGGRYQQIMRSWTNSQDWSDTQILEIWYKGDGINEQPKRASLSIGLKEASGETWIYSTGIDRTADWARIAIFLRGDKVGSPFTDSDNDFVMPRWAETNADNRRLDTNDIQEFWIQTMTFDNLACGEASDAQGEEYQDFTVWIDHIVRRSL